MDADLVQALIRLNIAGGIAILAVIALRKPIRRLAGARIAYGLWLAVPLIAFAAFLPARQGTPEPMAPWVAPFDPQIRADLAAVARPESVAEPGLDFSALLLAAWAIGVLATLGWVLWRHRQFLRELGRLEPREDGVLQSQSARLGPAVVGVIAPKVVLPADFDERFAPAERSVIVAHEARHVAAGHAQINALVVLAQCLNWFNPLVYLAAPLVRIDQELACDEAVIVRHPDFKRTYAEAMLKTQFAQAKLDLGCYWPSRSQHPLTERIAMLKRENPGLARRLGGVAGLAALTLTGGLTAWAAQPPRPPEPVAARPTATRAAPPVAPVERATAALAPTRVQPPAAPRPTAGPGEKIGLADYFSPAVAPTVEGPAAGPPPPPARIPPGLIPDPTRPGAYVSAASLRLRVAPDNHYYYSLPPMAVNVRSGLGQPDKYMKLSVTLELDAESAVDIERYTPRIMDHLYSTMQNFTAEDLARAAMASRIRDAVKTSVEKTLVGRGVEAVLIEELMVTQ